MKLLQIAVFGIIFAILFVMGMAVGYYIAIYQLNQIGLLALGAFGFAFLTWVGSGADLLGLLREWYKDKRAEEKMPILVFDGIWKEKVFSADLYLLRIRRTRGENSRAV